MDAKAFGRRLKDLREKKGLSQAELEKASGVSQQSISAYERGDRDPSRLVLQALIKALGVDCRKLMD